MQMDLFKVTYFAGLCMWKNPSSDEKKIFCEEIRSGEICYGELVITKEKSNDRD